MNVRTVLTVVVAGLAVTGTLAWGLTAVSGEESDGIRVASVGRATVTEVVEAPGTVTPRASAQVTATADGTVARLAVRNGQRVSAGRVLLRLSSPSAREQLRRAREAHAAASSGQVTLPDVGVPRTSESAVQAFADARAAAQRIGDPQARARALAAVAQAEAQYRAAAQQSAAAANQLNDGLDSLSASLAALSAAQKVQTGAAVAAAERAVEGLVVRAPVDGVVSLGSTTGGGGLPEGLAGSLPPEVAGQADQLAGAAGGEEGAASTPIAVGVPVRAGTVLATVTDVSRLGLVAEVDETDVLLVRRGVRADVQVDAVPGATYGARVRSVDPAAAPSARGGVTYAVRLSLTGGRDAAGEPVPMPRPGMSAVVGLRVLTSQGAVSVPASAVVRDLRREFVWVVEHGRVQKRTVELGAEGRSRVAVTEGLAVGEHVVVRGADRVRPGQEIG